MPEEQQTPATEAPAAEQAQPATPPAAPNPEQKPEGFEQRKVLPGDQRPEEDWRYAYAATQKNVGKLHARNDEQARQLASAREELRAARETLNVLAAQSLGPEQAKALETQQAMSAERVAALQAAQSLDHSVKATIGLADRLMASAGLSDEVRQAVYAAARNTSGIEEWTETVHAIAAQKIEEATVRRISSLEREFKGKALAEAKAEAEALLAQQRKELGIDKVDTSSGGTAPTKKSVAEMSDADFAVYSDQKQKEREQRRMQRLR